jgi:DNA-binding response OmpR family regulator
MAYKRHPGLRILVVEDNDDIRQIVTDLLKGLDYQVDVAQDGESGLACLQKNNYDLLITDLGLPGLSGWELARSSKRYQSNMPVLAISSWQGHKALQKIDEYGIATVIWKPFRFSQIKEAIEDIYPVSNQEIIADE